MTTNTLIDSENEQVRCFDFNNSDDEGVSPVSLSASSSIEDPQPIPIIETETLTDKRFNRLYNTWIEIDAELRVFEPKHKEYVAKLDEIESLKSKYRSEFNKYKKTIRQLQKDVTRLQKSYTKKGSMNYFTWLEIVDRIN